jgi:hypothetical protein
MRNPGGASTGIAANAKLWHDYTAGIKRKIAPEFYQ